MKIPGTLEFDYGGRLWIHIKNDNERNSKSLQIEIDECEWIIKVYCYPVPDNVKVELP